MERAWIIYLFVGLLGLAARDVYEVLRSRDKVGESGPVGWAMVVAMCLFFTGWFATGPKDPCDLELPAAARWTGLGLFVVGCLFVASAVVTLRAVHDTRELVTAGPFRWFRHPMYVGFVLWFVGWPVFWAAPVCAGFSAAAIVSVLGWARVEDRNLERRFGEAFRAWRERTLM